MSEATGLKRQLLPLQPHETVVAVTWFGTRLLLFTQTGVYTVQKRGWWARVWFRLMHPGRKPPKCAPVHFMGMLE